MSPSSKRRMAAKTVRHKRVTAEEIGAIPVATLSSRLVISVTHQPSMQFLHTPCRSESFDTPTPAGGRTKKSPGKEQGPPNKTPTRTTRATKGTKEKEHKKPNSHESNERPPCLRVHVQEEHRVLVPSTSILRPSTQAGVHQLGQRRYRSGRSVPTLDSQARTLKHQSEIYLKGDNKVEHHRLPESTRKP